MGLKVLKEEQYGWNAFEVAESEHLPTPYGFYVEEGGCVVIILTPEQARDRVTSGSDKEG